MSEKSEYHCSKCSKNYASMSSLCNHNKRFHSKKTKVIKSNMTSNIIINDLPQQNENTIVIKSFDCRYCSKKYKHKQNRWSHEQVCKIIFEQQEKYRLEDLEKQNEILRLKNQLLTTKRIDDITFKAVNKILMDRSYKNSYNNNTNSNNTNSNNIIQNTNNNYIVSIGNEDIMNVLTIQEKKLIINSKLNSLEKIVEITHCGSLDQFKNIIITNLKDNFAYKYDDKKGFFITVEKGELLNDLVSHRITDIEAIYDELKSANKIDTRTKQIIQNFLDKISDDNSFYDENNETNYSNYKSYKINNIKILLYNNQDKITKDIALLISDDNVIST